MSSVVWICDRVNPISFVNTLHMELKQRPRAVEGMLILVLWCQHRSCGTLVSSKRPHILFYKPCTILFLGVGILQSGNAVSSLSGNHIKALCWWVHQQCIACSSTVELSNFYPNWVVTGPIQNTYSQESSVEEWFWEAGRYGLSHTHILHRKNECTQKMMTQLNFTFILILLDLHIFEWGKNQGTGFYSFKNNAGIACLKKNKQWLKICVNMLLWNQTTGGWTLRSITLEWTYDEMTCEEGRWAIWAGAARV